MVHIAPSQEMHSLQKRCLTTCALPRFGSQTRTEKIGSPFWDGLAVFGNGAILTCGILQVLTPFINKKAEPVACFLVQKASRIPGIRLRANHALKLNSVLANRSTLLYNLKRLTFFSGFFQGINNYQTAFNTRQPSLISNVLLVDAVSLLGVFKPGPLVFLFNSAFSTLYSLGKTTDLENNNHPERIRDWDFSRLTRFLHRNRKAGDSVSSLSFRQEFQDFCHFIVKDFQNVFSLSPWGNLVQNYRKPKAWKVPQPYQSALSTQFCVASTFLAVLGLALKRSFLGLAAAGTYFSGMMLLRLPMFERAWQNRKDWDGKLVMAGIPLVLAGALFQPQFTQKKSYMMGLTGIGGCMLVRGLTLNSRKYRKEVDLLESLRKQSFENPKLTATTVLQSLRTNPDVLGCLQKQIGVHRAEYFINLLEKAEKAQKFQGIPLPWFLAAPSNAQKVFM